MTYNKTEDLANELRQNFIEYAAAVNGDRALPDANSGLKPVAKRILYDAYVNGYTSSKKYVKAAKMVGSTMGTFHPHGDSSIYGALVRLSQDWIMRYPLIDMHGNNGNIAGDGPAHQRYTEARLSKLAEEGLLQGIKKENVDFIPNYDETTREPVTLPTVFPNLLCNPNSGIGVAMACNWLPHNLVEVSQAINDYMDGKEPAIPGPDFPTGGLVINKDDIPKILQSGHGSVKVRGQYKLEGSSQIVFYEIPYGTTIESLLNQISDACNKEEVSGVTDLRDESNKKGIRIVIQYKRNESPEKIVQQLFEHTDLQTSVSYNQVALVDKTPTELNFKDCIEIYVKHNLKCLVKETQFDLDKAYARLHIIEGLLIALEDIDNVIKLIRESDSSAAAGERLMATYNLSEVQAKAITGMKLGSLAKLEKIKLQQEKQELIDLTGELEFFINSEDEQKAELRKRLAAIVKKYGDKRRTELAQIELPKKEKEAEQVVAEDVVVIVSRSGNVKRIPRSSFKVQNRGGKGVKNQDEAILATLSTNTQDNLLIFTSQGVMYKILIDNIPEGKMASRGAPLSTLIEKMDAKEVVMAATTLEYKEDSEYAVFITAKGQVKKTKLEEYKKIKRGQGIIALKLKEEDSLVNVLFMNEEDLMLITKDGMSIRFKTTGINPIGRATAGVRGMKLDKDDQVVAGFPIIDESEMLTIVTNDGYGKRMPLTDFPAQLRDGRGLSIQKSGVNNTIVGAALINEKDSILLTGRPNSICVPATEFPEKSRTLIGNQMTKSKVIAMVKL